MKTINIFKKTILLMMIGIFSVSIATAQTVYKGLRVPQLSTEDRAKIKAETHQESAKGQQIFNLTTSEIEYWDGTKWVGSTKWFYMPSIVIDVQTSGTFERDLYLEYKKQFADTDDAAEPANSPTAGTAMVKSNPNAPNPFARIYAAEELYYYVIGYDATVFSNLSITANGVLTYTVNADNVSDATFMNIVFAVK